MAATTSARNDAETRKVHAVFPGDTNHYRTLFGGTAMAWMGRGLHLCDTLLSDEGGDGPHERD